MTSPAARLGRPAVRAEQPAVRVTSVAHYTPAAGPLETRFDALGAQMLTADRFLLNIILE